MYRHLSMLAFIGFVAWLSSSYGRASETDSSELSADLQFLTSEELKGRSSVDPTIYQAAQHIADRFEGIGLKTDLFDGEPFQVVDIPVGPQLGDAEANRLSIVGATPLGELKVAVDFNPMAIGARDGEVEAEMVWVGYGVRSDEHSYDDYQGIDVDGKIVMMLRKEPGPANPESPFDGVENTRHAFFQTKVTTAIDAGAVAIILVNDLATVDEMVETVREQQKNERERVAKLAKQISSLPTEATNIRKDLETQLSRSQQMLDSYAREIETAQRGVMGISAAGDQPRSGGPQATEGEQGKKTRRPPVPVISISRQVADQLIRRAGAAAKDPSLSLDTVTEKIDTLFQPQSFSMAPITAKIQVELTSAIAKSPNVIGVLPGKGFLRDQSIVVGAHYDHVGMGGYGSLAPETIAVHNGADDNASGTAVMLQVAQRLAPSLSDFENRRRVVFIAFTGEERGLLGSKHYVEQPRFPITRTAAMINMDMVGRLLDNELTVYGTESADVMNEILDTANATAKFRLNRVGSGYGPSDHASFYGAGVPVLFFFTGLHSDYHRPSDDFDKLNLDGMARITDIVCQVSERLATMPERPEYTKTEANVQIRRQLTVFMGVKLSQQPGEVVFSSILADGPAEVAKLRAGDRLVSVAGKPVTQIKAFFEQLRQRSPGDDLTLEVRRDSETIKKIVKLRAR